MNNNDYYYNNLFFLNMEHCLSSVVVTLECRLSLANEVYTNSGNKPIKTNFIQMV